MEIRDLLPPKTRSLQSMLNQDTHKKLLKIAQEASPNHNKGEVYQARFEAILSYFLKKAIINSWEATPQNSSDDQQQVDYWVNFKGEDIPFQIKSHSNNSEKKRKLISQNLDARGIILISMTTDNSLFKETDALAGEILQKVRKREEKRSPEYIQKGNKP